MAAQGKKTEVETELKIELSPSDLEKVFASLSAKTAPQKIFHKYRPRDYFDTSDLALYHHNLSFRVQYKPGKAGMIGSYEQTVKIEMSPDAPMGDAVMQRKECKDNIKTHTPQMPAVTDAQARAALKPFKGKKLTHIFTAAIERRYFEMNVGNGASSGKVEVAFDVGKLILAKGAAHQDFYEIEVEVKQGGAELIDIVKKEIMSLAPSAKVQPLSKSAQGSKLYLSHKK